MTRARKRKFSKVKAVKATARASVGAPPVERVIEDPKRKAERRPRYRETLAQLLAPAARSAASKEQQEEIG